MNKDDVARPEVFSRAIVHLQKELQKALDDATTLSAENEKLRAQQLSVLTGFYLKQPAAVAEICDTVLDRSGALLGRVRDHAAEVKSSQALAGDDHGHR